MELSDQIDLATSIEGLLSPPGTLSPRDVVRGLTGASLHKATETGLGSDIGYDGTLPDLPRPGGPGYTEAKSETLAEAMRVEAQASFGATLAGEPTFNSSFQIGVKRSTPAIFHMVPRQRRRSIPSLASLTRANLAAGRDFPIGRVYFDKCSVISINKPDSERHQIVETWAADYLYVFGRRPRIYTITGVLASGRADVRFRGQTVSQDFAAAWERGYDRYFRASSAVKHSMITRLWLLDDLYTGYLLSLNMYRDQESQATMQFTMMYVIESITNTINGDRFLPGQTSSTGPVATRSTLALTSSSSNTQGLPIPDERRDIIEDPSTRTRAELLALERRRQEVEKRFLGALGLYSSPRTLAIIDLAAAIVDELRVWGGGSRAELGATWPDLPSLPDAPFIAAYRNWLADNTQKIAELRPVVAQNPDALELARNLRRLEFQAGVRTVDHLRLASDALSIAGEHRAIQQQIDATGQRLAPQPPGDYQAW